MAGSSVFPGALDPAAPDPSIAGTSLETQPHSSLHNNEDAKIRAIEATVGITGSSVSSSLTYIIDSIVTSITLLAPLVSAALTGTPTAPTASAGTNTTQIATTAFVLANAPKTVSFNSQSGTTYTFVLADGNGSTEVQSTSSSASTFTIPPNSSVDFPVGTILFSRQMGTGALTVAPGAGVTLHGAGTAAAQYTPSLSFTQTSTNVWCEN
jgi:hypothetical protein